MLVAFWTTQGIVTSEIGTRAKIMIFCPRFINYLFKSPLKKESNNPGQLKYKAGYLCLANSLLAEAICAVP